MLNVRHAFDTERLEDEDDRLNDGIVMLLQRRISQDAHQNGDGDGRIEILHRPRVVDQHLGGREVVRGGGALDDALGRNFGNRNNGTRVANLGSGGKLGNASCRTEDTEEFTCRKPNWRISCKVKCNIALPQSLRRAVCVGRDPKPPNSR